MTRMGHFGPETVMFGSPRSLLGVPDPPGALMTTITITAQCIDAAVACDCGQDLDGCGRDHCPRCGRELGRR